MRNSKKRNKNHLKNQKGQTLIEYLIIVALVGVGSIALMRAVSQNINTRFADVVVGLGGNVAGNRDAAEVSQNMYRKRSMRDFLDAGVTGTNRGGNGNEAGN